MVFDNVYTPINATSYPFRSTTAAIAAINKTNSNLSTNYPSTSIFHPTLPKNKRAGGVEQTEDTFYDSPRIYGAN